VNIQVIGRKAHPPTSLNGGGALVNMLSMLSWFSNRNSPCSVTKPAAWGSYKWSAQSGHAGDGGPCRLIDTDMAAAVDAPKSRPEDIAARVIEGCLQAARKCLQTMRQGAQSSVLMRRRPSTSMLAADMRASRSHVMHPRPVSLPDSTRFQSEARQGRKRRVS
jgi:hypothetical protein